MHDKRKTKKVRQWHESSVRKYPSVWGCFQTSLAGQTRLTRMQSFNQIAHSGDKWEERDKEFKKRKGTLNLWLTESCEGTLTSPPKSFKLGHVALAFVTLMLRNVAEWKSGRKFYKKKHHYCGQKMALMDVKNDRTPGTQILIWWLFTPTRKGGGGCNWWWREYRHKCPRPLEIKFAGSIERKKALTPCWETILPFPFWSMRS